MRSKARARPPDAILILTSRAERRFRCARGSGPALRVLTAEALRLDVERQARALVGGRRSTAADAPHFESSTDHRAVRVPIEWTERPDGRDFLTRGELLERGEDLRPGVLHD